MKIIKWLTCDQIAPLIKKKELHNVGVIMWTVL